MAAKHILYLTNTGLVSLVARGGRLTGRRVFAANAPGRDDFASYLEDVNDLATHVLTDLAEEDFRLDTIPHLGGKDREAVLSRKLAQIFRNSPYRHALAQGREPDGRRDDRVVYTAITNGELLRPWIEILEKHRVPLEGILSSAVFSEKLLPDLGLTFPHTLLVTFTPGDAIRQTYFREREIKFSRLTPVDLEEGDTLGGLLAGETARTWQYLDSQRYFTPADRLEVCVLVHAKDRAAVEPALRDFNQIHYRLVDIEQAAGKLGLKPPPIGSSAEELLAHELLQRGADNHFAPPESRRFAQVRRFKIGLQALSACVLAAGLGYGGWNLFLALQNREKDEQTGQRVAALRQEHEQILRAMPTQGVAGETMRDTVAFYAGALRGYPSVGEFLVPVSGALERFPRVHLTQLAWQAAENDAAMPALQPTQPRNLPPVKALAKSGEGAPPPGAAKGTGDAADSPFVPGRVAVALFEATVRVDGSDFRPALAEVEGLIKAINGLKGYKAAIVDSPLDITPKVAILGRFADAPASPSEARFTFKVTRTSEAAP
ncbi:MAG: hypothetical protein IPJ28_04165 [Betaproteobacteria bacterium]|nr:hypothetical protein [Betaproteobacteria bacterium]